MRRLMDRGGIELPAWLQGLVIVLVIGAVLALFVYIGNIVTQPTDYNPDRTVEMKDGRILVDSGWDIGGYMPFGVCVMEDNRRTCYPMQDIKRWWYETDSK